jgi:hypothetical protein
MHKPWLHLCLKTTNLLVASKDVIRSYFPLPLRRHYEMKKIEIRNHGDICMCIVQLSICTYEL